MDKVAAIMSSKSLPVQAPPPQRPSSRRRWLGLGISLALALLAWELVVRITGFETFILPPPELVLEKLGESLTDGSLVHHALVTLGEVLAGLALGATAATLLGYLLAHWPALERLIAPYIVASQSVPVVAIAPLLVIWFGPGLTSKVLICALIVFFPVLVNTIIGLRGVSKDLRDLMISLHATRWQTFHLLEAPAAMPVFLGGLRVGATLAVIGAVVGEFVGADSGLGFMINRARGQYDTATVFVAVLALAAMALSLYGLVLLLEKRLLAWQERRD
jgi:NitT/TauT family transport system permease protein